MRTLIECDTEKCEGCNRCIRVCPVGEANIAYTAVDKNGNETVKVRIDASKCIACGGCISICQHNARDYVDDTEAFFDDLKKGVKISLIAAPAQRTNFEEPDKVLSWLKTLGVNTVYDVSLGADICTWAHIRLMEKKAPGPLITQPCPAVVNYITKYQMPLIKNLSPVQSPMLCTAIYMKNQGITDRIAALSPCIAKANEFEDTNLVQYNVTFRKLKEYIEDHDISLPDAGPFRFDHEESSLGRVYPMPGGLKENVEYYLGKTLRIDKSEGQNTVYSHIDEYAGLNRADRPDIFDVLNCAEGCNRGSACGDGCSFFGISKVMHSAEQTAMTLYPVTSKAQMTEMFERFDRTLRLEDYLRTYPNRKITGIPVSEDEIEKAFHELEKDDESLRQHNCYACGSYTCREMAVRIAKGINVSANCMEKARHKIQREHRAFLLENEKNLSNIHKIAEEMTQIKEQADQVSKTIADIDSAIAQYSRMTKTVSSFARQINLLSLNAAIEAAHVGTEGSGFKVVVKEIRGLAVESQESVKDVMDTDKYANESVKTIDQASSDMQESINKAFDYFVNINTNM